MNMQRGEGNEIDKSISYVLSYFFIGWFLFLNNFSHFFATAFLFIPLQLQLSNLLCAYA